MNDSVCYKHNESRLVLIERAILQWKLIESLALATLGWLCSATFLFWQNTTADIISFEGITFVLLGVVAVADVFGVAMYFVQKFILKQFMRQKKLPDIKKYKRVGYLINTAWLIAIFLFTKYSFDLMYEAVNSLL